jgi:hypothetical protein
MSSSSALSRSFETYLIVSASKFLVLELELNKIAQTVAGYATCTKPVWRPSLGQSQQHYSGDKRYLRTS